MIMTPKHPLFYEYLHSALPPMLNNKFSSDFSGTFAVRADTLCLEPLKDTELDDYLFGGEYDEIEGLAWNDNDY